MAVKAKFQCNSIVDLDYAILVNMSAVYGNEGENADYAKATPCGNLNLNIDKNTKAANEFERGKYYYLTIEEAI